MSWRLIFILGLLAALVTGAWWLDGYMETQAWAIAENGQWKLAGTGWETLKHGWPLAVFGCIFGGGIVLLMTVYSYALVESEDHQNEINRLSTQVGEAKQHAAEAEQRAKLSVKKDREALAEREKQLQAHQVQIETALKNAAARVSEAEEKAHQAETLGMGADEKRKRAFNTVERMKRKIAKLEKKLSEVNQQC